MLLDYLREKNCFQSVGGRPNANPYWWGTILDFNETLKQCKDLLASHSIKEKRMQEMLTCCENDLNSPIVRLVGIYLKRELKFQ